MALQLPKMPLNVLVVGAGICGPAFAMLLQRSNPQHKITIIERFPNLRSTGQQIDLKTQAPIILSKMGLLDEIKSHCVDETGLEMVNSKGKHIAVFGVSPADERRPGLTSEHEIMRGDMVNVIYNASIKQDLNLRDKFGNNGGLTYEFGQTITAFDQKPDGVDVTFSDGQRRYYDLIVAADGQASHTRRLAFGREVSDAAFKSLGIHGAYFDMPRIDDEGTLAKGHLSPKSTMVVTRPSGRPVTGVLAFTTRPPPGLKASYKESLDKQKEAFVKVFQNVDWQTERFISGLRTSLDFYAHEVGQIKMKQLSTGRVVLLGDAGYCPSPFTGLGTNLSLVGAYILAGELARQGPDIPGAFKSYEQKMQPVIGECQQFSSAILGIFFPSSRFGVWLMHNLVWSVSKLAGMFPKSKSEKNHAERLPAYPELNLGS
jgi:2-polyprenyl-6-methoxyphenol hydroxylase-like FAD-dependent oxidoreductase